MANIYQDGEYPQYMGTIQEMQENLVALPYPVRAVQAYEAVTNGYVEPEAVWSIHGSDNEALVRVVHLTHSTKIYHVELTISDPEFLTYEVERRGSNLITPVNLYAAGYSKDVPAGPFFCEECGEPVNNQGFCTDPLCSEADGDDFAVQAVRFARAFKDDDYTSGDSFQLGGYGFEVAEFSPGVITLIRDRG